MHEETVNKGQLTDSEVKMQIDEIVKGIRANREKVRKASNGGELKRNPFQYLDERGMLTADNIVNEFNLIQAKKSRLSSNERDVIQRIVWMALRKAAILKANETNENDEQSNNNQN